MDLSKLVGARRLLPVAGVALVFAVGCGGETTDVSAGTADFNKLLEGSGATLDCPKEVDGGEGTEFDCTLKGEGGEETVKLKVVKEGDKLAVDVVDQKAFEAAQTKVAGG